MSVFVVEKQDGTIEYPLAAINIRRMFPNVSFPKAMGSYSNPALGIYLLQRTDPPKSKWSHDNVVVDPVKVADHYVQQWGAATPKPQADIDYLYEQRFLQVKQHAHEKIEAVYPDWKQRNMTMRVLTLQNVSPLTDDEQAELASISVAWDWIEAVRTASDQVEADLLAMGIAAAMEYDISTSAHWNQ
jgi:hypothetical protein